MKYTPEEFSRSCGYNGLRIDCLSRSSQPNVNSDLRGMTSCYECKGALEQNSIGAICANIRCLSRRARITFDSTLGFTMEYARSLVL